MQAENAYIERIKYIVFDYYTVHVNYHVLYRGTQCVPTINVTAERFITKTYANECVSCVMSRTRHTASTHTRTQYTVRSCEARSDRLTVERVVQFCCEFFARLSRVTHPAYAQCVARAQLIVLYSRVQSKFESNTGAKPTNSLCECIQI